MNTLWESFEHLDKIVYAIDAETYQMVYMNPPALAVFSLSPQTYQGRPCYAVLQGRSTPCPFCMDPTPSADGFAQWNCINPAIDCPLILKSSLLYWQDRKYRLGTAVGADPNVQHRQGRSGYTTYESMIHQCLVTAQSTGDPYTSLCNILRAVVQSLPCGSAVLYEKGEQQTCRATYAWPQGASQPFGQDIVRWCAAPYHNESIVLWQQPDQAEASSQVSFLLPLVCPDGLLGFLGLSGAPADRMLDILDIASFLSHFAVPVLQRRDLTARLEKLSFHDPMTGALNRYALNEFINSEASLQPLGLVFCDVIGLKNINDLLGHASGDQVISQVDAILSGLFSPQRVYRIGGDEFLAVSDNISQEAFSRQIDRLHQEIIRQNCSLSVGSVWAPVGKKDFTKLLKVADERMYADKQAFYRQQDPVTGQSRSDTRRLYPLEAPPVYKGETGFQTFLHNYYFDANAFFQSVAMPDTAFYLYCGDIQKNIYFISDNLRDDFNFSDNLVYDFVTLLEQRIYEPDQAMHIAETRAMFKEKKTVHSIRYRIYNKKGELVWMHCRGILKWNDDMTMPLFFSGTMITLKNESEVDPATGLLNTSSAIKILSSLCSTQTELLILCFTFPNFSDINRTFGRSVGDSILREMGCQMEGEMGQHFRFFRLDGMHFLAISQTVSDPEAPARNIHRIVADTYRKHGIHLMYPCSVGVLHSPQDGSTAQELIDNAITVSQSARSFPSLPYLEFSPHMSQSHKEQTDISLSLNYCVNHSFQGFRIVIQPQVLASSGQIFGGEVLLRWTSQGQSVPPSKFIPVLEQTGLIVPVGKWVFIQAAKALRQILDDQPDFLLSVNVSYLQLMEESFLPFLQQTMENYGISGKNLLIELTETHFDEMPDHLEKCIRQCEQKGIQFVLDDFGQAYSSLQLLLQYPAKLIKLDRNLTREITSSSKKLNFIISVICACHQLGKKVCIEGVETAEELEMVRQTTCDYIQGFYFYKPMELDDLFALLRSSPTSFQRHDL